MSNKKRKPKGQDNRNKEGMSVGTMVMIIVLVVVCVFAGMLYVDTFHGSGRLRAYMTQLFQEPQSATPQTVTLQSAEMPLQSLQEEPLTSTLGETHMEGEHISLTEGEKTMVAVNGEKFFLCSRNGVKFFKSMGDQKWSDTFNMNAPQMVQEGSYIAVGEISGKNLRVYNEEGFLYAVQTEGTISQFSLNNKGYLSVITKEESGYRIQIYNMVGTVLKGRVEESRGIYPLSSDVSDDNKAFVVSYVDTTDIEPIAKVLFFYINVQDSESYTDSMYAAVEKVGELIPIVKFMNDGTVVAVADENIYGFNAEGKEVWAYGIDNALAQVSTADGEHIVLGLGDGSINKDGREKGLVCILNSSGKETASFASGSAITYLHANANGIVVGNGSNYTGVRYNGKEVWNSPVSGNVSDVILMDKATKTMVVTSGYAAIVDMKNSGQSSAVQAQNEATNLPSEEMTESNEENGQEATSPEQ